MDISVIQNIQQANYVPSWQEQEETEKTGGFDSIFKTALNMLEETNDLQNKAEEMEIQFALGQADNAHDLQIAQQKANMALSYTVAVRDKILEAYNSIMNMQM